jgi:hypothetical protein
MIVRSHPSVELGEIAKQVLAVADASTSSYVHPFPMTRRSDSRREGLTKPFEIC